jgi:hypothetical protein
MEHKGKLNFLRTYIGFIMKLIHVISRVLNFPLIVVESSQIKCKQNLCTVYRMQRKVHVYHNVNLAQTYNLEHGFT